MISTKGRYALVAMVDIAINSKVDGVVSIKDISKREDISEKYLEQVISSLVKARLLRSIRGSNGGYVLNRPISSYSAFDILSATEGELSPILNIDVSASTYPFWKKYEEVVEGFLKSISLENIINDSKNRNYFDYTI